MRVVAATGAAIGYAWLAAGLHPFTWPMRVAVAIPILLAALCAWRSTHRVSGVTRPSNSAPSGLAVWALLFAALAAWQLAAYFSSPRADHPTLSSLANDVMGTHLGRAVVIAGWLALGAAFFVPRRWARR